MVRGFIFFFFFFFFFFFLHLTLSMILVRSRLQKKSLCAHYNVKTIIFFMDLGEVIIALMGGSGWVSDLSKDLLLLLILIG